MLALFTLPQASTVAKSSDALFNFITVIDVISFVGVIAAIIYFITKYNRKHSDPEKTPYIEGHPVAEGAVMILLFVLVMVMFAWGWIDYVKQRHVPENSLEINVVGRQWLWNFEYTNGRKFTNELTVPKDQPVKLVMSSVDVLHSFYIPAFRVKQDVVPGSYQYLPFTATETGTFQVFCAEYCGTSHSGMLATIKVVEKDEYEKWQKKWEWETQLGIKPAVAAEATTASAQAKGSDSAPAAASAPVENLAERGKKLFNAKGCNACHSVNTKVLVGPPLNSVFGREVELTDGKKATVDENYIRQSLMDPTVSVVKGFQPLMPTFKGTLSDDEVDSLIAYIKSLANQ